LNFEIITVAPLYFILVCILAAALFTWLLYNRAAFENKKEKYAMGILRFLGLFFVFVLLLSPFVKLKVHHEIKPELLVFTDVSNSLDSVEIRNNEKRVEAIQEALGNKLNIKNFYFAGDIQNHTDSVLDKDATQLSAVFDYTNDYFEGGNTAGIVILSDGIYNRGMNPLYKSLNKKNPVYFLGSGDTTMHPDIWISQVNANSTVFLGNEFTINANLRSSGLKGKNAAVNLLENGKVIQSKNITIGDDIYFANLEFNLRPNTPGTQRYTIQINAVAGEHNLFNNSKNIFVKITDTRRKICICYHAPHPDIGALYRSLEEFGQYEIVRIPAANLPNHLDADVYVLHGFSANAQEQKWIDQLISSKKPIWNILTAQSESAFCNYTEAGIDLRFQSGNLTDAQAVADKNFSDFLLDDEFVQSLKNWPPLKVPFGKYDLPRLFKTVFIQKIGAVESSFPLMGYTSVNGIRQSWLFGEGLWRWRMSDMQIHGQADIFDAWVAKNIQYLSTDAIREKFRVFAEATQFSQEENAIIFGEYLEEGMTFSNQPDAEIKITGPNGYNRNSPFARSGNRYRLELGKLPEGDYQFSAKLALKNPIQYQGKFVVLPTHLELENTRADFDLMRKIAARNKGKFFPASQYEKLIAELKSTNHKSMISEEVKAMEFIRLKWVFALILILFSAEWFLRKRAGSY